LESNNTLKKSLLLIPDISGFTKFVNETEIVHGVHIISELLEIIIKNNTLGLEVAEIEGDAVLFYKYTDKPTIKELYEQCKKMFIAFHHHIKYYERDRICDCGSCSNTPQLTLKFVIHYGDVIERNILGHFQLMGADVTTAHKLMKNDVPEDEYILISEGSFLESEPKKLPDWFKLNKDSTDYKDIGIVSYHHLKLTELHKEVPVLTPRKKIDSEPIQLKLNWRIKHPLKKTFELLTSLERKYEWIAVKAINFDKNEVERVGTKHECITPAGALHIETIQLEKNNNTMYFAEFIEASGIFPSTTTAFKLQKENSESCTLILEVRFKKSFINTMVYKPLIATSFNKNIKNLEKILKEESVTNKKN
tara:strand:+ start:613 stop:1704 length:1092 start_codon:yes stop_codon:yes gene_type:complete